MRPIAAILAAAVIVLCAGSALAQEVTAVNSASIITNIQAHARDGQVFITWDEAAAPEGAHLKAYLSHQPITANTLAAATVAAEWLELRSGCDWWQDPLSFISPKASNFADFMAPYGGTPPEPVGFVIGPGGEPVDPAGGLFVHTVTEATQGPLYAAVTLVLPDGQERTDVVAGANSLADPTAATIAPPQAIYIGAAGAEPAPGSGQGKPLVIRMHGRGGGHTAGARAMSVNYLMFGDTRQGWREGLAQKFMVTVADAAVYVTLSNRQWTGGRPVLESPDGRDHCPAINNFYYGYNSRIYETTHTEKTIVPNYTEEQILAIVRWAEGFLGADPNRTHLSGGSMGGSGGVSLAMHYPEVFEYVYAHVPAVAYLPGANLNRLECFSGPLDETAVTGAGVPFIEHMNGIIQCQRPGVDLPFIWMQSGRADKSIAWVNNPPFYREMNQARQALVAYWSGGEHGTAIVDMPKDRFIPSPDKFRRDTSYIVFTNNSDNRDPGEGDPADGDVVGWINRGIDWTDIIDEPDQYAVTVQQVYEGIQYPITVDITARRVQQFTVKPGDTLSVTVGDGAPRGITVDEYGLITAPGVQIGDAAGTRVVVRR